MRGQTSVRVFAEGPPVFVEGPQEKHFFCVTCVRSLAIPAHSLQIVLGDAPAAVAGDLGAVFLPRYGMLGASLRHRHVEILRRVQDLEVAAAKGSTAGIPLLHPWANRLAGPRYRTAGREVVLDPQDGS